MASIRIHQDVYNYERKRKGFTNRQWVSMILGGIIAVAVAAIFGFALRINYTISASVALCAALPVILAGFMPMHNMAAEEFLGRLVDLNKRGNVLVWQSEEVKIDKGELSKEYVRSQKKKGTEAIGKNF